MAVKYASGKATVKARVKVFVAAATGLVVSLITGFAGSWLAAPLLGWDAAALIFLIWTWRTIWPMDGRLTSGHALREDPSRATAEAVVLTASVASLAAVGAVLAGAGNAEGGAKILSAALGALSVVIAWTVIHTLFTLQYAELYYYDQPGGVDFPDTRQPAYKDFAYLAFTLGMTFQVSDTSLQTTEFRRRALHQSLISYLFGTVIVATTINLIAGLTS